MTKTKVRINRESEYLIGILGPRYKGNYGLVLPGVIKAIDLVEFNSDDKKSGFVLVHDGVTSGITGEVMEAVNKTQPSLRARGRNLSMRKLPLDIQLHGKQSHYRWVDQVIEMQPDLMLVFDNGEWHQVTYAIRKAQDAGIETMIVKIRQEQTNG